MGRHLQPFDLLCLEADITVDQRIVEYIAGLQEIAIGVELIECLLQ